MSGDTFPSPVKCRPRHKLKKNPYKTIDVVTYDFGTKLFIPLCDYIHHLTLNILRVTTYVY